jgi:hypothetical protein
MAKQYRIKRKIASMPITAGGFLSLDLPRGYDYEAIGMRISGTMNVTTAATSVRAEAPCQLVPRVEVIADGKNNLFSAPFWYTCLGNVRRRLTESGARATTPPTAAAIAAYVVEALGIIDFSTIDGIRPKDSNFRSRNLSLFQLRLTYGQALDMFVPGAGVVSFTGIPVVDVFTLECIEETDAQGNYTTNPIALKKVSFLQLGIAASNANLDQRIPAGNLIRSVLIRTDGLVTAGEPGATVLNNAILAAGVDVRHNLSGVAIRALNNADYGQMTAGYYAIDLMARGPGGNLTLSDLWDVSNAAEPKVTLDVNGGATVTAQIVTEEYLLAAA